jgi:hypothetical protein
VIVQEEDHDAGEAELNQECVQRFRLACGHSGRITRTTLAPSWSFVRHARSRRFHILAHVTKAAWPCDRRSAIHKRNGAFGIATIAEPEAYEAGDMPGGFLGTPSLTGRERRQAEHFCLRRLELCEVSGNCLCVAGLGERDIRAGRIVGGDRWNVGGSPSLDIGPHGIERPHDPPPDHRVRRELAVLPVAVKGRARDDQSSADFLNANILGQLEASVSGFLEVAAMSSIFV